MKMTIFVLAASAALALPAAAAGGDHKGHDHSGSGAHAGHDDKARHGGIVRVVKDVNYELVLKGDSAQVYIIDHGKPVDLKGATGKLTVLSKSGKNEAALAPAGDRMEAKGTFATGPGTKVIATIALPGGAPAAVSFTMK